MPPSPDSGGTFPPRGTSTPEPELSSVLPAEEALIPFNSGWEYPTIVNWRPGDGMEATVNPPRFSWPYLEGIITEKWDYIPQNLFQFEIASTETFTSPEIRVTDTPYNFYNALAPLDPGTWYWRVGYGAKEETVWSEPRRFVITPETPAWDRTLITSAAEKIASIERPRIGPDSGDWAAFNQALKTDPSTANRYTLMVENCDRIMALPWWEDFPETDNLGRPPQNRNEKTMWVNMLKELTIVAYVYKLTGDEQYAGSIPRIVEMASWPRGGLLSPEALSGHTKMPSQAAELFAVVYDWFSEDLDPKQAATLKEAIRWRLQDMYFDPNSIIWKRGDSTMYHAGLAYTAGSHPYQNYAWALPAVLLMAGDLEVADELTELSLHYLTGFTMQEGPEEGYNEGHGYSNEKAGTMLDAAIVTHLLLPEMEMGKNPAIMNLVEWFAFMFSGPEQLPWGDSWLRSARNVGGENLRKLAVLTGSPLAHHLWQERGKGDYSANIRSLYNRPWFDFAVWDRHRDELAAIPKDVEIGETLFLDKAGWVFDHTRPILSLEDYEQAVGMQMQFRPLGGYSHSYPSDGSFAWFGHGALLSSGGGWRSWASLGYSRDALSHNSLLINGKGHTQINRYQPQRAYTARPLAYQEADKLRYWASELTPGYPEEAKVEMVIRHVVRVDDVYILYDELIAEEPSTFHWLFHVFQDVPVELAPDGFTYTVDGVKARVQLAGSGELEIENRIGRDGYVNPVTGEDHYPADTKRATTRSIFKKFETMPPQHNNLMVANLEKSAQFTHLAVLSCAPEGTPLEDIKLEGSSRVILGDGRVVSFDPAQHGDITVDPSRVHP